MSAFTAYAAHAELIAAVHPNDEAEMLTTVQAENPEFAAYPVSGDMLALVRRGSRYERTARRKRAAAERITR